MKRITNPAELETARLFYVHSAQREAGTFQRIRAKVGDAEAFTWKDGNGTLFAVCFLGRAQNPWSGRGNNGARYWFSSEADRRAFITKLCELARRIHEADARRAAEKAAAREAGHALKVGAVLRSSWGYEQTNIDYYQVTRMVGKQSVGIRPIARQSIETLDMQGKCVPCPDEFTGEEMVKRVSTWGKRDSVKLTSYSTATLITPTIVEGMKVYPADHWRSYA